MLNLDRINHWIFDLDNTLYPAENNLFSQVSRRMGEFIAGEFDLSLADAKQLQKKYFQTYGTTLRGLMTEHDIPPENFLSYVHDIDFEVLRVNHKLNQAIYNLEGSKVIYTNASQDYAEKILEKIGLGGVFGEIFDIKSADYLPKPVSESYHKIVSDLGIDPKKSIMVEDIARNLVPASEMGMQTVWVKTEHHWSIDGQQQDHIDHTTSDLGEWLHSMVKD